MHPKRIRQIKRDLGLTNAEFATLLSVSTTSVDAYLWGKRTPENDRRKRLLFLDSAEREHKEMILGLLTAQEGRSEGIKVLAGMLALASVITPDDTTIRRVGLLNTMTSNTGKLFFNVMEDAFA